MNEHITGSSQDEIVLIEAIKESGIGRLIDRNSDQYVIEIMGKEEKYNMLKINEFTSERRMMSVVFKEESS